MSVRSTIVEQLMKIAGDQGSALPSLKDDLALMDSGLDSLGMAILVIRLEEELGTSPFTDSAEIAFPVTLGDLVRVYERAAASG